MGFLIRLAFWFSLVLLALPFDVGPDEQGRESVNPIQALIAAREAVGDIAGICERKPDVCETGASAVHTISERAKQTARIAATLIEDTPAGQAEPATTGSISSAAKVDGASN
ncbi:hypothetical protein ASD50_11245 [Mesorhizobium sp. Root552]|jgi:hypothetical protein|uniref:DUF5330 domain-containing protein n=1 Tax=Mesorhizobium sp. Root552 TaxID=1736555 RepID=UPI0006F5E83F|nr:DUF5330 domain-containing protein [Mesorhizobium sp. Root552]KQZ16409.1 hypothetical protein ASD50_11245 [Mesorhizobium sp. Root552]